MARSRPFVISIAGFDPSGGAGVLADIKTMEQHKVYGFGVVTAITYQTEDTFMGVNWNEYQEIIRQLEPLLANYSIGIVKIGIIPNWELLHKLCEYILIRKPNIKIIIDPIIKATASKNKFVDTLSLDILKSVLSKIYLITPNWEEAQDLVYNKDANEAAQYMSSYCNVYLKGGHRQDKLGLDTLFLKGNKKEFHIRPKRALLYSKHGSGCILSSAIVSNIAKGYPILKACVRAKEYTESVLAGNSSLLAWHKL